MAGPKARIKVTGYLNPDDMNPSHLDLSHEMGLSEKGYLFYSSQLGLDDVEFEREGDAE